MTTHPFIPLYVDDYDAATAHLSIEEDGVYSRLIRLCWRTPGCSLPDDVSWIARKVRVSPEDTDRILKPVLDEFFTPKRGRLIQKRLKREYDSISRKKTARKLAGKKGGTAKAMKSHADPASIATVLPPHTRAFPEPESEPKKEGTPVVLFPPGEADRQERRAAAPTRGSRLDPAWTPSRDHRVYAEGLGFSGPQIDRIAQDFRDYWCAKAGKDAVKVDWGLTWQGWARREADRNPPPAAQRQKQVDWC